MTSTHALWVNSGKSKLEKLKSGHYTFSKYYIQAASQKKQYHFFFDGAPKISKKKNPFLHMHFGLIVGN